MSFFVRSKPPNGITKFADNTHRKRKAETVTKNDEVTSSEDEEKEVNVPNQLSEDENETAQEKKLRLAKLYLEEIVREEKQRRDGDDVYKDAVSERLKADHLKQIGKYTLTVADKYKGVDESNVITLKSKEQRNTITCLCVSSSDALLFSGSKDGVVVKWSLRDHKKTGIIPFVKKNADHIKGHTGCIHSIAISMDSKFLVVGDASGLIQVWNPDNLVHVGTLKGHKKAVTGLCVQRDTHTLYSASNDKSLRVWSLDEMAFVETLFGHQDGITCVDVLNIDRPVSSGGRDGTIRLWKVSEESQLIYNAQPSSVDTVKLITQQNFISGGDDGQLSVWSSLKKRPICCVKAAHGCNPLNSQPNWITAVAAFVHSDVVASGSEDGFIRIWKLGNKYLTISKLLEIPVEGFVNALTFTSNGKCLIAGLGRDHKLGRWNTIKSAVNCIRIIPFQVDDTS